MLSNMKEKFASEMSAMLHGRLRQAENLDLQQTINLAADKKNFWEIANILGNYYNTHKVPDTIKNACIEIIDSIRAFQGKLARESKEPTLVVFGTSGWRGVIGEDFTIGNVHKVARGIIEMMQTDAFLKTNGYQTFDEVRQNGILLLRDNRFMGDYFLDAAMKELAKENIKIFHTGECPTGVGSAMLTELHCAGSLNFTPSHNPMEYAGLKFNPGDGGPADSDLTSIIEEKANRYMRGKQSENFQPSDADYSALKTDIDAAGMFTAFVEKKSRVFNLEKIRAWLSKEKNNLFVLVDNMHGSSRGYLEVLLGENLVRELKESSAIRFLHTNDDYSFHGVKPEPSAKNQKPLIDELKKSDRKYTLAVALDPDADRIRFADAGMDIDMNRFGAIAYGFFLEKGLTGGIASTAPSSDFALEIAKQKNLPVFETAVGFKHFRQPLSSGEVLLAFEESDGISFRGHTLEKCALAGFLAALEAMAHTGKNLSQLYREFQRQYGYFYPDKAGAEVKGVSIEAWQDYKKAVLHVLQNELFKTGDTLAIGSESKEIVRINTIDGLKVIFADKSWILLRPSGTEPKFRYYYEIAAPAEIKDVKERLTLYRRAAETILNKARAIVDQRS